MSATRMNCNSPELREGNQMMDLKNELRWATRTRHAPTLGSRTSYPGNRGMSVMRLMERARACRESQGRMARV